MVAVAGALAAALVACGRGDDAVQPGPTTQETQVTQTPPSPDAAFSGQAGAYGGDDLANDRPVCFVALGDRAVDRLWALGDAGRVTPAPERPAALAAPAAGVFLGVRASGGYEVAITDVRMDGDVAVLTVATREPGGGMAIQALTSPYALVALPATATGARTEGSLELDCERRVPNAP